MRRGQIYIIIVLAALIILLLAYQYLFSIYEVDITVSTDVLYVNDKSVCIIEAVPLNSLGMRAPFRDIASQIEIREGSGLVDIIVMDEERSILKLRAKDKPGNVVIYIKPDKALLPSSVEIRIIPNIT